MTEDRTGRDNAPARHDADLHNLNPMAAGVSPSGDEGPVIAQGVDDEPRVSNERVFAGPRALVFAAVAALYASFHLLVLNVYPLETWTFRLIHIAGALLLGFTLFDARAFIDRETPLWSATRIAGVVLLIPVVYALVQVGLMQAELAGGEVQRIDPDIETYHFGYPLMVASGLAIVLSWFDRGSERRLPMADVVLVLCGVAVAWYLILVYGTSARMATGTAFAPPGISWAAIAGIALILELTRRVAGMALVIISLVFIAYVFTGPYLPGFLNSPPVTIQRFFSQVYTDAGVLGPTTAVSSTYIILFIIFAGFLQASKVGDYFVNFAFAAAGRARGGPAKVSVFASGLMGMINGTSAGNVVATGSLTIPLMKKVGYPAKTAGAIEAAASTGGQIMPPIMGAGAFIMAEITGIPYTDITIAALIPAILYFLSILFMVDLEAGRLGMRGMREDELPKFAVLVRRVYLFIPIVILIYALFVGYSVIRAGTLATAAAAVVSWLPQLIARATGTHAPDIAMGPRAVFRALELSGRMSIQIITVCACAGVIVGVISLTGVGARFSSLLLGLAEQSQLLAMVFAMCIAILLGMGMPTTAAYAVAASVVAPGLIQLGVPTLTAHFFVFYFAVVSSITPPVALAAYAAAGISGADPMATSVTSFKIGLAAFIVPFMFFYNAALLMQGDWLEIGRAFVTACIGVYLLSAGVQAWFAERPAGILARAVLIAAAMLMIEGGIVTDLAGGGAGRAGRRAGPDAACPGPSSRYASGHR